MCLFGGRFHVGEPVVTERGDAGSLVETLFSSSKLLLILKSYAYQ